MAAEMAVNMAVQDVLEVVRRTLIDNCPHKEICQKFSHSGSCDCIYLDKHISAIKSDKKFCFSRKD